MSRSDACDFVLQALVEVPHIEEPGAFIDDRQLLHTLKRIRVIHRDRRKVAKHEQERDRIVGEHLGRQVEELNDSQQSAAASAEGCTTAERTSKSRWASRPGSACVAMRGVGDDQGSPRSATQPAMPSPSGRERREAGAKAAIGDRIIKISPLFVGKQQGPGFRLKELLHLAEDRGKNRLKVKRGGERPSDLVEDEKVGLCLAGFVDCDGHHRSKQKQI